MTVSDFYSLHRDYQMRIGTPKETLCLLYLQTKIPVISISPPFGSFAEVKGIVAFIELHS
ncbi:hypothetical protein Gogos_016473 [Gossypium gossypioides]|uniref:Uncharacterized protein n=1 Tax=Gossypium gossypioides TaxID=34282 RepID=A0A7J9B7T7_GOSGO|nr:hypothetical protein [Gossypium gossypioides]